MFLVVETGLSHHLEICVTTDPSNRCYPVSQKPCDRLESAQDVIFVGRIMISEVTHLRRHVSRRLPLPFNHRDLVIIKFKLDI